MLISGHVLRKDPILKNSYQLISILKESKPTYKVRAFSGIFMVQENLLYVAKPIVRFTNIDIQKLSIQPYSKFSFNFYSAKI